jgi:hypothetical protein
MKTESSDLYTRTVFIAIDHGIGMAYFLNTDLLRILLDHSVRIVLLVQDEMIETLKKHFSNEPNIIVESLRLKDANRYFTQYHGSLQANLDYIRRTSLGHKVLLTYVDTHRQRKEYEAESLRRKMALILMRPLIWIFRYSKIARLFFRGMLEKLFTPELYSDLFEKYQPDLVISDTAGWRLDQFLLRQAHRKKIKTGTVVIGWDNPSSQGLPGAEVDDIMVWSEIHKKEAVDGMDWDPCKVHVCGMPLYDGYISGKWLIGRKAYYQLHSLDPKRKLISFAATALSISPNFHIIEMLAEVINSDELDEPSQLLIRLHPNHFKSQPHYQEERKAIFALAGRTLNVHVVEPKEVLEGMERYSGEDYSEKASMLKYSDVLVTVYSTMVVEAALQNTPFISACINTDTGWEKNYWIPLSEVPGWPTARRVVSTNAGKTVFTRTDLVKALNDYLEEKSLNANEREHFIEQELTYIRGESTSHTGEAILSILEKSK